MSDEDALGLRRAARRLAEVPQRVAARVARRAQLDVVLEHQPLRGGHRGLGLVHVRALGEREQPRDALGDLPRSAFLARRRSRWACRLRRASMPSRSQTARNAGRARSRRARRGPRARTGAPSRASAPRRRRPTAARARADARARWCACRSIQRPSRARDGTSSNCGSFERALEVRERENGGTARATSRRSAASSRCRIACDEQSCSSFGHHGPL